MKFIGEFNYPVSLTLLNWRWIQSINSVVAKKNKFSHHNGNVHIHVVLFSCRCILCVKFSSWFLFYLELLCQDIS